MNLSLQKVVNSIVVREGWLSINRSLGLSLLTRSFVASWKQHSYSYAVSVGLIRQWRIEVLVNHSSIRRDPLTIHGSITQPSAAMHSMPVIDSERAPVAIKIRLFVAFLGQFDSRIRPNYRSHGTGIDALPSPSRIGRTSTGSLYSRCPYGLCVLVRSVRSEWVLRPWMRAYNFEYGTEYIYTYM